MCFPWGRNWISIYNSDELQPQNNDIVSVLTVTWINTICWLILGQFLSFQCLTAYCKYSLQHSFQTLWALVIIDLYYTHFPRGFPQRNFCMGGHLDPLDTKAYLCPVHCTLLDITTLTRSRRGVWSSSLWNSVCEQTVKHSPCPTCQQCIWYH
jgi:hypothetical protein